MKSGEKKNTCGKPGCQLDYLQQHQHRLILPLPYPTEKKKKKNEKSSVFQSKMFCRPRLLTSTYLFLSYQDTKENETMNVSPWRNFCFFTDQLKNFKSLLFSYNVSYPLQTESDLAPFFPSKHK